MSSRGGRADLDCKLYVGDLARDTNEKDVERAFSYYGRLRSVWVARNPAGFAFVEYEDSRDADDAVRGLDGTYVIVIELLFTTLNGLIFFIYFSECDFYIFLIS